MDEMLDVVIVGAGLSGVGTACHLKRECPGKSIAILEARERSGGTWDLFRYPGIRSDSDMHTLGYNFKPWEEEKAIADGPSILRYIRETATEHGLDSLIEYQQALKSANWNSARQCWELSIEDAVGGKTRSLDTKFLLISAGYYRYDRGHQPEFAGRDDFKGEFVHPQNWPEDLDYTGKRVVVIGSGATAMTLVPAMADKAAAVTMLQRSPTWVISTPAKDRVANFLRSILPTQWAYNIVRWKNTRLQAWAYRQTRRRPEKVRKRLLKWTEAELNGSTPLSDFTPSYDPWDQRLCLVPDSDLFAALRRGKAKVVTQTIDRLTENGIRLSNGQELEADIIVSATGLELQIMGGVDIQLDGQPFDYPSNWSYRGMMISGLPNMVSVFGYINASWTLRADIVAQWTCRLLNHMDATGKAVVTPQLETDSKEMEARPWIDGFSAGYMEREMHRFPQQGDRDPWINSQNYLRERQQFAQMNMDDPALRYDSVNVQPAEQLEEPIAAIG